MVSFALMAVLVWVGVAGALRQQGQAKTYEEAALDCQYAGDAAHTHDVSCYDAEGALVCPLPEREYHVHDESCYASETYLVCGLEEGAGAHWHSDECYDEEGDLVCGLEESSGHVHTDECWQTDTWLGCGKEEVTEEHVHGDGCFKTVVADDEDEADPVAEPEAGKAALPTQSFEAETEDGTQVSVEAPEGALPEGSTMSVTAVDADAVAEAVSSAVEGKVRRIVAVDITFLSAEGAKVDPLLPLSVRITSPEVAQIEEPVLVHVPDEALEGETQAVAVVEETFLVDSTTGMIASSGDTVAFEADQFSVYAIVETVLIDTPAGELFFEGDGYTVKVTYTEESEIPLGTELTVRELEEGTEEYAEYFERTQAALRGDEEEVDLENESASAKLSRLLGAFDEVHQTKIFDIVLTFDGEEIEPNLDYPLQVEVTFKPAEKLEDDPTAKIVHFAEEGTEVISDVELQENKDGSVTLSYEQNSFSRTAASLLGSYGNGGWIGGNGNTLVFRYGYATINGEPIFEIQYNGGVLNTPTLVATPGSWPGDAGYPHNPQTGECFDGTCDPGTTMMELIEACNNSALATSASCTGFKVIMGTTYTVDSTSGAHSLQTLGQMGRDLRTTVGDSFVLGRTSEEYWYSPKKVFRIERGLDANGNGWHDSLIYNRGSLPLDILAGVIIDNKSANSDIRESDGADDSKTGAIYPIAVTSDGSLAPGATSASGLTMMFNGCYITDSSYNGTPVGTGVKIVNLGSLEMFSHGNTATGAASSYIENMAVAVDQISGKTRLKTAVDPFGSSHHNTIGVALSYSQSIGKWYLHLNANMSRIPIWLRSVTQWKSGDIVMDSGWQIQGQLKSPVENNSSYMDINKLNLVNQNNTSTVMGLEFYVGTNDTPYPVIRFYAGTVYNTRTHQWYRTLYDAVTPGAKDVTGAATQIQDGDTLVFYGNTMETNQININYDVTIRGAFDSETINGTETGRAALGGYTCQLVGASTNWIAVAAGKTVTFGGNATTNSNGTAGTVTSGNPGTLIVDGGNAISYDIVNWGTTNLKSDVSIRNASVAGVFQDGVEHLYEGATFSGNAADQYLTNGSHYITLETMNPNSGNAVTVYLNDQQFSGRDVVVAGTTENIQNLLDANYLAKFPLTNLDDEYDYVYTINGGPNGERVLELKQKATVTVRVYKVDEDGNSLNGAGFTLYKVNGTTETPYTIGNEANPHTTSGNGTTQMSVREGDFKLKETGVPAGYDGAADLTFTVTNNNGTLTLSGTGFSLEQGSTDIYKVTVQNTCKTVPVTLRKVDASGNALGGVTFGFDSQTTNVTTGDGTSGTTLGEVSLGNLTYGTSHTLHETWSHTDYQALNGDIAFAVNGNTGAVTITSTTGDTVTVTGDATTGYVITITNQPSAVPVQFVKVDGHSNKTLSGARFTASFSGTSVLTSDANGILRQGSTSVFELPIGQSALTETVAPDGYKKLADNVNVTVSNNGVTYRVGTGTQHNASTKTIDGRQVYVVEVPNYSGTELPQTGGSGTTLFTITGFAVCLAAAVTYGITSRRRSRREVA